jgi:hypothetical protein
MMPFSNLDLRRRSVQGRQPRNSIEGQLNLLAATNCRILLTAEDATALNPLMATLTSMANLHIVPFKSTEHWFG